MTLFLNLSSDLKKKLIRQLLIALLITISNGPVFAAHKASIRLSMAKFTGINTGGTSGTVGGNYSSTGSPDFLYLYCLKTNWAPYVGFDFFSNSSTGNLDLWALRLGARYYFRGENCPQEEANELVSIRSISKWSFYVGAEMKRYQYFLGSNPSTLGDYELSGNYFNQNVLVGLDYRLSNEWEINAEVNKSLISLASTDNRIKAEAMIIYLGAGYHW